MKEEITKHYSNGEVTVKWQPHKCIHSTNCFKGLPQVFNPSKRPWVDANGATTEQIIDQVSKCPSGALSYFTDNPEKQETPERPVVSIEIMPDGPMLIHGDCNIKYADGTQGYLNMVNAFCRCGQSLNKPYCDGSHNMVGFRG